MGGSGNPGSDIELFSIFENRHYAADQVYFYESNSKNSAKFSLSKNHRDLKNEEKIEHLKIFSSFFKEKSPKENSKFYFILNF